MMQTLVVILQRRGALLLASIVLGGCIDDIACQDVLPEGEASTGAWDEREWLVKAAQAIGLESECLPPWRPYPEAMLSLCALHGRLCVDREGDSGWRQ
jgi:hypothetical protein